MYTYKTTNGTKKRYKEIWFNWQLKKSQSIFPCYKKMHVMFKREVSYFIFQGEITEQTERNNFQMQARKQT